jgi:nitrite reductase (NO-forming)
MIVIIIVLALVLVGGYMLLRQPTNTEESTVSETEVTEPTTMVESPTSEVTEANVVIIDMEAGSFYYTPKTIQAKVGQTVRVNLTAKDMMHDFNIDELNVDGPVIKAGSSTVIEFVASEAGDFEYYCSVGNHRANGQVGTLTVTE